MEKQARGTFDVKMTPQAPDADDATMSRLLIDKQIHGDLEATTQGQMLACLSPVDGSAGYVAIERVTGTLDGRTGSFVLQHHAFLNRGAQEMDIRVVPDTGADGLEGITGAFKIIIQDGKHSYEFAYALPEKG